MSHATHMHTSRHTFKGIMAHRFIGKIVFICLKVSVNLVYKFQGKPGTTTVKHDFNPNGLKFHRGSPWVSILSWLNLKATKDYFSYEDDRGVSFILMGDVSHMNEVVLHVWMREVTPMKSHVIHANLSRHTHTSVPLLIWLDHITHINPSCLTHVNASCHTCKWDMSRVWKCHIAHLWRVMSQTRIYRATYLNVFCITYESVMTNIGMRHVAHIDVSCNTYSCVTPHI